MPRLFPGLFLVLVIAVAAAVQAAEERPTRAPSGLLLPRFVSLGAAEVNVRTGPGRQYPIAWVFVRRDLPVEVLAEFGLWRKVRDIDGAEGWAHRSVLSGHRTALIIGEVRTLRLEPDAASLPVLLAEPGVQGSLLACRSEWCRMEIEDLRGWLPRAQLWGVHAWETFE
jgi:SH3-like domain-containing protein